MEIRLTRRPGQAGTKKFTERYGERLVCVRYRYDEAKSCRHKTVELIVETVPWTARGRRARRRDEEMVAVRIGYNETDLRERAKRLGAIWRPNHRLWEMRWLDAKHLGIADRVPPD
jgi:hypothetical protein